MPAETMTYLLDSIDLNISFSEHLLSPYRALGWGYDGGPKRHSSSPLGAYTLVGDADPEESCHGQW